VRRTLPRAFAAVATSLAAATAFLTPAHAITDGHVDGNGHPMVGLMVAQDDDGNPLWRCTGTLVGPKKLITAGHCTSNDTYDAQGVIEPVDHVEVWFAPHIETSQAYIARVEAGDPTPCRTGAGDAVPVAGYPCTGEVGGTAHVHPDYDPDQFWKRDIGAVVLDSRRPGPYASLPAVGAFDSWKSNRKQRFTSVGYGLQKAFPDAASWKDEAEKTRMVAKPRLITVNKPSVGDYNMVLSNNANTGGTCFGDSGGPNFVGDSLVIAGVTSYGKNPTCGGQGGIYRLDRQEDVAWLRTIGFR
jgi:hypothetical protein